MFFRLQVKKQLAGRRLWSQLATVLPCFHPRQRGASERRPCPSSATSRMPVCSTFPSRFKTQWRMRGFSSTRSTETTWSEQHWTPRVQLTHGPPYLSAEAASTDFSLLDEKPLLALNCVGSVEITKAFCNDCIAASSKLRAPMKWALHSSTEDHLPYIHVRLILLCSFFTHTVSYCRYYVNWPF